MSDIDWVAQQEEGQFFERKSAFDDTTGTLLPRDIRAVAKDIAETLVAMANADGGALVIGIEDDKTLTGLAYSLAECKQLRQAPKTLIVPPLTPVSAKRPFKARRLCSLR